MSARFEVMLEGVAASSRVGGLWMRLPGEASLRADGEGRTGDVNRPGRLTTPNERREPFAKVMFLLIRCNCSDVCSIYVSYFFGCSPDENEFDRFGIVLIL